MQELVGRLAALDPEVADGVKVIGYFDALVAGSAGAEALVRGAAVLSGAVAGVAWTGGGARVSPEGVRLELPADGGGWPRHEAADAQVWLERVGPAHANDEMVLERFALAVAVLRHRQRERSLGPLALLVDADRDADERARVAARARVAGRVRVVALDPEVALDGLASVLPTTDGPVRVGLLAGEAAAPTVGPVGLGTWGEAADLPRSWTAARRALRISRSVRSPVDAEELGAVLDAAACLAGATPQHPDLAAVAGLDDRSLEILDAVVVADSLRTAAVSLQMHHSTLAARRDRLAAVLGYDPWSAPGRTRYQLARLAARLR